MPNQSLPTFLNERRFKYVYGLAYAVESGGTLEVYHTDGLGSARAITDAAGNVTQTYLSDEFGNLQQTGSTSTQPFQFAGQQRDAETSLYYLRARMYDPATARFLSRDPFAGVLSAPGTLNRYAYVGNNPVSRVDPSGLCGGDDTQQQFCMGSGGASAGGGVGGAAPRSGQVAPTNPVNQGKIYTRTEFQGRRVYQRVIDWDMTDEWGRTNRERVDQGLSPIGPDGKPINPHHILQDEPGPMAEVPQTLHRLGQRILHGLR